MATATTTTDPPPGDATRPPRVLVVTGGLVNAKETAPLSLLKKQLAQSRAASAAWLEARIKLNAAEVLAAAALEKRRLDPRRDDDAFVLEMLRAREFVEPPELTEVVLATALRDAGATFATATLDTFFADDDAALRLLDGVDAVFLSTTLLRDWSELGPVLRRLRRGRAPIVVGGALTGSLVRGWAGHDDVDVLAVGYGEVLVPALVDWLRRGGELLAPTGGEARRVGRGWLLVGGLPEGRSLDHLPTPDWGLIEAHHGVDYDVIHYESVRGCPFRCAFCNYPYLFSDTVFRMKSAQKIADDWERSVKELGVTTISCLDSLFTTPKKRLLELCDELVRRGVKVRWVCYARATDLTDEDVVIKMVQAGAVQVQIGCESGDQGQLDRMNKKARVEDNARAIALCRKHGLTTVCSFVVGYPGETDATIAQTAAFLAASRPDFTFLATFSTRVADVPVLSDENRARFGLQTMDNPRTIAPYWRSDTMSCAEAVRHVRALQRAMAEGRWSLDASIFYGGLLRYDPARRDALLDFQRRAFMGHPVLRRTIDAACALVDDRLGRDVERYLPRTSRPPPPPPSPSSSSSSRGLPVVP